MLRTLAARILALSALFSGGAPPVLAQQAVEPAPEVWLSLDTVEARPGAEARLTLSVRTDVPIKAIAIALDFDESLLRFLSVVRLRRGADGLEFPPDIVAGAAYNNLDSATGDQSSEGWLYVKYDSVDDARSLDIPIGETSAVLGLDFQVLSTAPPGLAAVRFASLGPAAAVPEPALQPGAVRTNVVLLEAVAPQDQAGVAVPDNQLQSGGIKIIGEVGFFMRGDANYDLARDIGDPLFTLIYLFRGSRKPPCLDAADANDDGGLGVVDAVYTLQRLYVEPGPFPPPNRWGRDESEDSLSCEAYLPTRP